MSWKDIGGGSKQKVTSHGTYRLHPSHAGTKRKLTYMSHKDDLKPNASAKELGFFSSTDDAEAAAEKHHAKKDPYAAKVTGDTKTFINTPGVVTFDPKLNPDQYRAKHGECPDGYHWDGKTKRCIKAESVTVRMNRLLGE